MTTNSPRYCPNCGSANSSETKFCGSCGKALQETQTLAFAGKLPTETLLNQRYRILHTLGQGGMGSVYSAEDTQLGNRKVAVKEMSQSGLTPQEIIEATDAFKQEAHILAALQHPNLPSIHDHFSEAGRWYLVMSFIQGETLEEYLNKAQGGRLPVEEVLQIGVQLCRVLQYLHSHNPQIIFRDLKPGNVMRTPDGHLYLIDFGIARFFKVGRATDTVPLGTPGFAAPEQYGKGQTSPSSDIYSLGATLYFLLSGQDPAQFPFRFPSLRSIRSSIPQELEALIVQMVELDQNKRLNSAAGIQQELQRILDSGTSPSPSPLAEPTLPADLSTRSTSGSDIKQRWQSIRETARQMTQQLTGWLSPGSSSMPPCYPILPGTARLVTQPNHFFISYHKTDRAWAEWIAWELEEAGYTAILPDWDFRPGAHFEQEMQKASDKAECIIVVLSPHYLNARTTQSAWTTILKRGTVDGRGILLPVCIFECGPKLNGLLGSIIYIDLVGLDESLAREKLLAGIRNERWKPTKAPVFPGTNALHSLAERPLFPIQGGTQPYASTTSVSDPLTTVALTPLQSVEVFFSYSHVDAALRIELEKYLSNLKRQRSITGWHDGEIGPGNEWAKEIEIHLSQSHIILLLVSQDFIASDYCFDIEMRKALERHNRREAFVIPIILRPAHWKETPFGKLQALPTGGKPVTMWQNRDEAFLDVVQGIQRVVSRLTRGN